jgi:hypothetical protein
MRDSDPNDPMSFYNSLQKNFADAGLGQQAMMAAVEGKKFESEGLKTEAAKTALYKANPALLDVQIEKARTAGNDKLANQLAEQRGQIQVQTDLDRSKEAAQIGLIGAQTAQAKAAAQNYATQAADNKVAVTSVPDGNGGATIIYADKQTGKEVNRITVSSAVVDEYLKNKAGGKPGETKPTGERKPLGEVLIPTAPAAPTSPVAASVSNVPNTTASSAWNDSTKTYTLTRDPAMQQIQMVAAQNADRLNVDPQFREAIVRAQNDRIAQIKQQYGSMINILN